MYPAPPSLLVGAAQGPGPVCIDPNDQSFITPWPYYSTVKFVAARTGAGAGPFLYTIAQGTRFRAFAYAVGDAMQVAGYSGADGVASFAETNLTIRNQTTSGEDVLIHGVSLMVQPSMQHLNDGQVAPGRVRPPDYRLLAELCNSIAVSLSLNGDSAHFPLGTIPMIPGAGGLLGGGPDLSGIVQAPVGKDNSLPYGSNGWPVRSNFYPVPEGLIWRHQGQRDSQLNLVFEAVRAISIPSGGSPENNVAVTGVDTAGVYVYPTELFVGIKAFLHGSVYGPRSRHQ